MSVAILNLVLIDGSFYQILISIVLFFLAIFHDTVVRHGTTTLSFKIEIMSLNLSVSTVEKGRNVSTIESYRAGKKLAWICFLEINIFQ